ncbi:MAG: LysM peptidoglycan-binding domain-containing protein [Rhodobacteraceae bacterium]|nr:LysM peptidoglycan-binding domain-containing protein [Paracoccaceae bacterium]MCF8515402.1 LysM peptidoglycan-binding domain-containing protein [Paracoccaceae bacterium]
MASWTEMSGGARAGLVALGVAGVTVVGALVWRANQPVVVPQTTAQVASPSQPAAAVTAVPEGATPLVPEQPVVAAPISPSFDNWRVEGDGSAVVSGRAEPGAAIAVLVDGAVVADTFASGSGAFALLFTLAPNDRPSIMMLEATLADGTKLLSAQTIALAPILGPVIAEVASVEAPEPAAPPAAVVVTEDTVTVVQPLVEATPEEPAQAEPEVVAEETIASAEVSTEPAPQPVAEAPLAPILIDAISYNAAGDVLLSGKGQGGQFVRVYLDNALTATAGVAQAGTWQVTLIDTAPGIYTLRVDQIDADGKVTARYETPFQRETREALAALAQPAQSPEPAPQTEVAQPPEPEATTEVTTEAAVAPTQEAQVAPSPAVEAAEPVAPAQAALVAESPPVAEPVPSDAVVDDAAASVPAVAPSSTVVQTPAEPEPAPDVVAAAPAVEATPPVPEPEAPEPEAIAQPAPVVATVAPEAIASQSAEPQSIATATVEAAPAQAAPPALVAQPAAETAPPPVPATVSITVQPGYTLWGIARASLGDGVLYVQVFNANKDKIRNPDLIYPGQVFTLPVQ